MTTVTRQIHFAVKGRRKRALPGPPPESTASQGCVPRVAKLMALAIHFNQLLQKGVIANQSELARLAHVTQPRMTQIMNLLHLAPDIQEEILFLPPVIKGRDPITERDLRAITREVGWDQQRQLWLKLRKRGRVILSTHSLDHSLHNASACSSTRSVARCSMSGG